MSLLPHPSGLRETALRLAIVSLLAGLAVMATGGTALGSTRAPAAKPPCIGAGKGLAWSYKGQKGTVYTVLGVNGASCSLGLKWLMRLTHSRGYLSSGQPAGWQCIVNAPTGECSLKSGAIFEWTPKLK